MNLREVKVCVIVFWSLCMVKLYNILNKLQSLIFSSAGPSENESSQYHKAEGSCQRKQWAVLHFWIHGKGVNNFPPRKDGYDLSYLRYP